MFCTRCGKQLNDNDRFCAHCGARIQELEQEASYGEVVFNPPFRREAEARTREIEEGFKTNAFEEIKEEPKVPKHESINFDWNLDGYPKASRRHSDDAEFNWGEVIEKRRTGEVIGLEKIFVKRDDFEENAKEELKEEVEEVENFEEDVEPVAVEAEPTEPEPTFSIEDLEKELFGSEEELYKIDDPEVTREYSTIKAAPYEPKDKFYTYNAKNDAFQELLDREKARLEEMTNERSEQWKEITLSEEELKREPVKPLEFNDVFKEPEIGTPVEVVVPPLPSTIEISLKEIDDALEEELGENEEELKAAFEPKTEVEAEPQKEAKEEAKEEFGDDEIPFPEEHEGKAKLRFSDVFPRNGLTPDDDNYFGGYDPEFDEKEKVKEESKENFVPQEEEREIPEDSIASRLDDIYREAEEEESSGGALKAIIIILAILIIAEIVLIAIKFIAPTSAIAVAVDGVLNKITSLFV